MWILARLEPSDTAEAYHCCGVEQANNIVETPDCEKRTKRSIISNGLREEINYMIVLCHINHFLLDNDPSSSLRFFAAKFSVLRRLEPGQNPLE